MSERFFIHTAPRHGRAVLDGDEARHLARVLRGRIGDNVRVFDGSGCEWPARIALIGRDEVIVEVGSPMVAAPERRLALTLAVALPKGERQKWLVEKLTELGTDRLVPLVAGRGVAEAGPAALGRLRRGVIEACKQCGRNTLMAVAEPATIVEVCAASAASGYRAVLCDPDGHPLDAGSLREAGAVLGLVGPEGGFTADEIAAAATAGAVRASLGPHVLRVETAAVALAARLA